MVLLARYRMRRSAVLCAALALHGCTTMGPDYQLPEVDWVDDWRTSLYGQVGLKNGDIIRKVNGQQITSAEEAMIMYQALQSATMISVELMRAGKVQQVHYNIR